MYSVVELQQELIGSYLTTAINVLVLLESMLVISQEINAIWCRRWTMMTWLYALTRYSTIVYAVNTLLPIWNLEDCIVMQYIDAALQLTQFLCFALFSALRVYSLLEDKYIMAGLVFLLNMVPFATNLFDYIISPVVKDAQGCVSLPSMSDDLRLALSSSTRIAVVIGDILVLAVTWMKTVYLYKEAMRMKIEAPLATLLLRDGTFYFIVLLATHVLEVIAVNDPTLFAMEIAGSPLLVFTPIIICRFILNLRQVGTTIDSWPSTSHSTSLRFVGNMGQSLRFGGEDEDEEEFYGVEATSVEVDSEAAAGVVPEGVEADGGHLAQRNGIDLEARQISQYQSSHIVNQCRSNGSTSKKG